jgi:hypothetical protein
MISAGRDGHSIGHPAFAHNKQWTPVPGQPRPLPNRVQEHALVLANDVTVERLDCPRPRSNIWLVGCV